VRVPASQQVAFTQVVDATASLLVEEFAEIDPKAKVEVGSGEDDAISARVWSRRDRDRILDALLACPHGVLAMSRAVAGLVETSNNLAVVASEGEEIRVTTSGRSSVMSSLRSVNEQVAAVFRLADAEVETHDGYPGWKPNPASAILQTTQAVYEREFGHPPEVKAIHAGLECGLISEKLPGIDMVSLGPQIESPHSPDERVKIPSVASFYKLLKSVLAEVA
jgi:dipeptidase D